MTIWGPPRTKKTSNEIHLAMHPNTVVAWVRSLVSITDPKQLMRAILSRVKVQPNKLWRQWAKKAPITVQIDGFNGEPAYPIEGDVHVCATFYRQRAAGDLLGYEQGLADLLQDRKIVKNDRQIVDWDGSRLNKDKERPRVEFTLTEVGDVSRTKSGGDDDIQEALPLDS